MPLLGKGVMAFWNDIAEGAEPDFHFWHVHEHIPERLGVPGFLRGRRYTAISGSPKFFNFYETESLETLTSKPYLERLDNPTSWSRKCLATFRNSNRSLCRLVASFGRGEGGVLATIRLAPAAGKADGLRGWLVEEALPAMVARPGVAAAHLVAADEAASRTETSEKAIRGRPDEIADWVLLIDAIDPESIAAARADLLSDADLARHGAVNPVAGVYRLTFSLSAAELVAEGRSRHG